jgi:hypothetical protein
MDEKGVRLIFQRQCGGKRFPHGATPPGGAPADAFGKINLTPFSHPATVHDQ